MAVTVSKGERTRQRLLDAAIKRFAADGYRRTSVSEIARDAGITPAAAYAYFENKEALFQAAVDVDAANLIERARPSRDGTGTLTERWLLVPGRLHELVAEHPLAKRVLGAQEPEVLPQLMELPALANLRAQLAEDLEDAQRSGEVRSDVDPQVLALGLESIVLSLLMTGIHVQPDETRSLAALTVLDAATRPSH
jgi:AcrR family transcriptional regulator